MAGEWQRHEVSHLIDEGTIFIGDGYRAKNTELGTSGLPFARAGNINNGFRFDDADHYPEDRLERVGNKISQPGDVVFTSKGTVGRFAFVGSGTPRFVYSPQLCFWRSLDPELIDPRFLFFWMAGREFFVQFKGVAGQTDMAEYVSLTDQRRMHITLPPVDEQRAIARILGTLDDKIELNRRMSETLEAMARALFKSWFVDFLPVRAKMAAKERDPSLLLPQAEPNTWYVYAIECNDGSLYIGQTEDLRQRWLQHVGGKGASWTKQHPPVQVPYWEKQPSREAAVERENWLKTGYGRKWLKHEIATRTQTGDPVRAKMEGRDPGLPQPLADLFPDSFEDSELGEIPRGWEIGQFREVAEQLREQENPLLSPDVLYHHFSLPAFDDGQHPKSEYGDSIKSLKLRVPSGVVLLSKLNPEIQRVWLVDVRPSERAVCSTEFLVLRARPPFTRSFVYCLARSPLFRQQIEGLVTGTSKSHQRAQVESILNIPTVVPPSPIVAAFAASADSLLGRTLQCRRESRTLAAQRDALLPKLISGELRVKDAEKFIGGNT